MIGRLSSFGFLLLCVATACTDPVERAVPVSFTVDADSVVRANTTRVELEIQARTRETTWQTLEEQTFKPLNGDDWPWRWKLSGDESNRLSYSLIATARDGQGAVVGRAQAVRELAEARRNGVRVHFDTACFRRAPLCDEGLTCEGGECVDASSTSSQPAADGGDPMDRPGPGAPGGPPTVAAPEGIAAEGVQCTDGERACESHGSRTPMLCERGAFRAQSSCSESQRCDTAEGANRGTCQPIVSQCMNRQVNVPYCEGEAMRVCVDLVASLPRVCAENEWCVPDGATAACGCRPGFVPDPDSGKCGEARECGATSGGCDRLTRCSMVAGQPVCGACPSGYSGTGESGCAPLLSQLQPSHGSLDPSFDPKTYTYRLVVPLLAHRVAFTPSAPPGATITLNGAKPDADGSVLTQVLALDETPLDLVVTSGVGAANTSYRIVVERTGVQEAYIKTPNPGEGDQFGVAVAMSDDTLVATAVSEDSAATGVDGDQLNNGALDSGAAHVYVRDGDGWKHQAYLKPNDTAATDYFGARAVIEGDTIVLGALHEPIFVGRVTTTRPGGAYVFARQNGVWSQTQRLSASNAKGADLFGAALSLDGDTIAIGAPWEGSVATSSGSVYVFERTGGTWRETQILKANSPNANGLFGSSVALEGDRLIVGAADDNRSGTRTGSVEIFVRREGTWRSQQWLQPEELEPNATFGFAVAVRGDRIVVGAPRTPPSVFTPGMTPPGAAYVYELQGDRWTLTQVLRAQEPRDSDLFGTIVSMTDSLLAVGASADASGARGVAADPIRTDAPYSGAVYLYAPTPEGYVQSAYIKPSNTDADDRFGFSLAIEGTTLAVGAFEESGSARGINGTGVSNGVPQSGAVYVFR